MRRFFVPQLPNESEFGLPESLSHRLHHVLRLQVGDVVALLTPEGSGSLAEITRTLPEGVFVRQTEPFALDPTDDLVTVYQCWPKGRKLDQIVQDCTELGASRVVPVLSERTVFKWETAKGERRLARLRSIAQHAAEQSGRTPPEIATPVILEQALCEPSGATRAVLNASAECTRLGALIEETAPPVDLLIGPEGGFAQHELSTAAEHGWIDVSLGPRTVRTETAATAALAIMMDRWGR